MANFAGCTLLRRRGGAFPRNVSWCEYFKKRYYATAAEKLPPNDFADLVEKRTAKARAKKRLNWENLSLYGALIQPPPFAGADDRTGAAAEPTPRVPAKCSTNWTLHRATSVESRTPTQQFADRPEVQTCAVPFADSAILGNGPCSTTTMEQLQSPTSVESLFTAHDHDGSSLSTSDFPLFAASDGEEEEARGEASEILQVDRLPEGTRLPSASTVLRVTMPPDEHDEWRRWRLKTVERVGVEAFVACLRDAHQTELDLRERISRHLRQVRQQSPASSSNNSTVDGYWRSLEAVLSRVTDVESVERSVVHPRLCYTGVIDCVATYEQRRVLVEWCMPFRFLPLLRHGHDLPLQAVAYLGAAQPQVDAILLVTAFPDGDPAATFLLAAERCRPVWSLWLRRLRAYWQRRNECPHERLVNVTTK